MVTELNKNIRRVDKRGRPIKVVKIISDKEIVINAGQIDEIFHNDIFEIYQKGMNVIDPDTNENLGSLDYIKARIIAKSVLPNMSICVNAETLSDTFAELQNIFSQNSLSLNVDSKSISGGYENFDKKIKIGDSVRLIKINKE